MPRALGQAELAQGVVGGVGLVLQAVAEGREVEHGVGVGDDEGAQGDDPRQHEPASRRVAPGRGRQPDRAGRHQRQEHDPAGVLRRARQPEPDAGEQVVAQASLAQHAGGAPQREGDRRQRRDVVERQVRVEDGQEGAREQRRGQQADGAAEELGAGQVQQPHRERADRRGGEARDDEDLGRVGGERLRHARAPAEPDVEDDVQQVRVRRRVDEVVRVPAVAEEADRVGDEMRVLVGVVGERQPLLDAPHAQAEGGDEHDGEPDPPRPAALRDDVLPPALRRRLVQDRRLSNGHRRCSTA